MRERSSKAHRTGRWEIRAYDRTAGRQVSRIFIGGKRDARKALDALVAEVDSGIHTGGSSTLGQLLSRRLAGQARHAEQVANDA